MLDLNTLYQQLDKRYHSNGEEFVSVQEMLRRCQQEDFTLLSGILSLYYLPKKKIYEMYWLDLFIEPSDGEDFEEFILNELRVTSLDDINPDLLDMRRRCFIQMTDNSQQDTAMLIDYLNYILSHNEMKEEIRDIFGDYDERYLAMAFYL